MKNCSPRQFHFRPVWRRARRTALHLIAFSAIASNAAALCEGDAGRLESMEGSVAVERVGTWQPLAIGACIPTDARVQVSGGRAVFRLANETLLRTSNTTLMRFAAPQEKQWIRLFDGILHFITRTPHAFDVQTDYVNAGVKGTEFMLTSSRAQQSSEVIMLEGEVLASNAHGEKTVRAGEAISARNGLAPTALTIPALRNAVQWTLYYPPLPHSNSPHISTAAQELQRGNIAQAQTAIEHALAENAHDPHAIALQAMIELVTGNTERAAQTLDQVSSAQNASISIARSYIQQAQFQLKAALTSAQQAASLAPDSALVQARLAELSLINRDTLKARAAVDSALDLQPDFARAHAIAGFIDLQRFRFDAAKFAFEHAVTLDATDPLPRLGLGLILIRQNHLHDGREQLAIAVALDPGQSLLRSYLGKAYQEENRERLASDQYALAKTFDSADPTPWLYSALLARAQNRPFDALDDLNRSIELNDNRGVYRSRLQLDADEAARTASQADIYQQLGFNTLARQTATRAVSTAPGEYGGHRMLAEAYADDPQYDAARASEVLQAQLLQPLSASPLLPILGETNLLAIEGAGPSALGFREYNAMFVREKPWLSISGLGGSNHTGADEISLSGIYDRVAYALSQYHYETQGYRDNNDARYDVLSAYTKVKATENLALFLQANQREEDRGNIADQLATSASNDIYRYWQRKKSLLLGAHFTPLSNLSFLTAMSYQSANTLDDAEIFDEAFAADQRIDLREKTSNVQLQTQLSGDRSTLIAGTDWAEVDSETYLFTSITPLLLDTLYFDPERTLDKPRFRSAYAYVNSKPLAALDIQLGSSYAELEANDYADVIRQWAPKVGVKWQLFDNAALRLAYFESLKKPLTSEASIEPSQLAGFNQIFDDQAGSKSRQKGIGFDIRASTHQWLGVELLSRKIDIPFVGATLVAREDKDIVNVYWGWAREPWAVSVNYEREQGEVLSGGDTLINVPYDLCTQRVPIEFRWLAAADLTLSATTTYIDQNGKILANESTDAQRAGDNFLVTDIAVNYRFQRVELSVMMKNLFNKSFEYQNSDFFDSTPNFSLLIPERSAFASVKFIM